MISIVIPTKNERWHIGSLLDCLAKQDITEDVEVVIADAHSTDDTRAIAESFRGKFHSLRIVDGGVPPVARNRGARASSGDPILFIDADVTFQRADFLRRTIEYFRSHGLSIGVTRLIPRGDYLPDRLIVGFANFAMRVAKYVRPVGSNCLMISRAAFERSGGYPEDRVMCEEHDLVSEVVRFGAYDLLPIPVIVSMRRLEKEGRLMTVLKYLYSSVYRVFVGPITKPLFTYEFSYSDKENAA